MVIRARSWPDGTGMRSEHAYERMRVGPALGVAGARLAWTPGAVPLAQPDDADMRAERAYERFVGP